MYGVEDPLAAFCFDRAVTLFGQDVESDIHTATQGAKTDREAQAKANLVLQARLNPNQAGSSGFKDPAKHMSF